MKTQLGCKSVQDHSGFGCDSFNFCSCGSPWNLKKNCNCPLRRNFCRSPQPAATFRFCSVCGLALSAFKIFYFDCSFSDIFPLLEVSWDTFRKEGR